MQPNLFDAAKSGDISTVRYLLDRRADVNSTDEDGCSALQLALGDGFTEIAVLLLDAGADRLITDHQEFTLLHWASLSNNATAMSLSFVEEVGVNPQDINGRTPLSWASSEDNVVAVKWLLGKAADCNSHDRDGWTPLHYAAANSRIRSLELIMSAGANVCALSNHGETPYDVARRLGSMEAVLLLKQVSEVR